MNVFELFAKLNLNDQEYNRSLNAAERRLENFGRTAQNIGGGLTRALTLPIAAIGGASILAASNFEETEARFLTVFQGIEDAAEASAQGLQDSFGQSARSARELLGRTGDLLVGFGFTRDAALNLSTDVNELAVDLASFNNVQGGAERASQALTSALLGETESLKSLGIVIRQEAVQDRVDLMRATGELTTETDLQAKAIATYDLIIEQSGNAIGDYERTQDSFANSTRELRAAFEDLRVEIGEKLLPIVTPLVQATTDAVEAFNDFDPAVQNTAIAVGGLAAVVGPILFAIGTLSRGIGQGMRTIRGAVSALPRVFARILGPRGAIILAIAAFVGSSRERFDGFVEALGNILDAVDIVLGNVAALFGNFNKNLNTFIQTAGAQLLFLRDMFRGVGKVIRGVFTLSREDIQSGADMFSEALGNFQRIGREAIDEFERFTFDGETRLSEMFMQLVEDSEDAAEEAQRNLDSVTVAPSTPTAGVGVSTPEPVDVSLGEGDVTSELLSYGEALRTVNERRRDAVRLANAQFGSEEQLAAMTEQARLRQEALGLSLPIEEVVAANAGTSAYTNSLDSLRAKGAEATQQQQQMAQQVDATQQAMGNAVETGLTQFATGLVGLGSQAIATGQTVGQVFATMALNVVNSIIDQIVAIQARILIEKLLAGATLNFVKIAAAGAALFAAKGIIAGIKANIGQGVSASDVSGGGSVPSSAAASTPAANAVIARLDSSVERFGTYVERLVTEGIQVQLTGGGSGTAVLRGT